jgi:putative hydrolase of HD superfamily
VENAGLAQFFALVGELKRLPRQGWLDRGVPQPESVADHTYRLALMAWTLGAEAGMDAAHLVKLVLVHDLPEALAGDATPYRALIARGLTPEEATTRWHDVLTEDELAADREDKTATERAAMAGVTAGLDRTLAEEMMALWEEYVERRSQEARFVSQLDKLEALVQALEYERAGHPADVASFRRTCDAYVTHPVLRGFLATLDGSSP